MADLTAEGEKGPRTLSNLFDFVLIGLAFCISNKHKLSTASSREMLTFIYAHNSLRRERKRSKVCYDIFYAVASSR